MRLIGPLVREVAYVVDELVNEQTLDLFGLRVTTQKRAMRGRHEAMWNGVELGANGTLTPELQPKSARVLQLVR